MHSRIFGVSLTPLTKEQRANTFLNDDRLFEEIYSPGWCDYISDNTDFEEDVQWLQGCYPELCSSFKLSNHNEVIWTINKNDLRDYFYDKDSEIQKYIDEEGYNSGDSFWCYRLTELITPTSGFYVYVPESEWFDITMNLDQFLQDLKRYFERYNKDTIDLYIYRTYDYHN